MRNILMLLLVYYIQYSISIETDSFGFYERILNWIITKEVSEIEYKNHTLIEDKHGFSISAWDYDIVLSSKKFSKTK
jgi:hypothetical protein